jgi:dTDP-4-amino-4,6-dideoxygalactose transaminase
LILQRTVPPAAAPVSFMELLNGFRGMVNGSSSERLEREVKEYFRMEHVFLASSGKAALFLILSALKRLTGKKKVVLPAYTCFSVPSAVRMAGLEIVLCDIQKETLDYDYSQLKQSVDDDTLCILSTHLFGIPSDVSKIKRVIGSGKIFIVEDAAQAMGAADDGNKLGTLGDVGFFSLGRGKNISSGSGGVVITSSKEIADSIRKEYSNLESAPAIDTLMMIFQNMLLAIFIHPMLYWLPKNLPFLRIGETKYYSTFAVRKMSGFQAGLLRHWRPKLEMFNRQRSKNAEFYIDSFRISGRKGIYANGIPYNRFPIYVGNKSIKDSLCKKGDVMGISPMYPSPIHKIPEIKECFDNHGYEQSNEISDTLVTLPTHPLLINKDLMRISETVNGYFESEPAHAEENPGKANVFRG